jgi:hypothetical protein
MGWMDKHVIKWANLLEQEEAILMNGNNIISKCNHQQQMLQELTTHVILF